MSLKENVQMVKEELSSEEKMFESAVKAERFWKQYRTPILAAIAAVVLFVAGSAIYSAQRESGIEAANRAYVALLKNPEDAAAEQELRERDPALYDAWRLSRAVSTGDEAGLEALSGSDAPMVSDIAAYELAVVRKDAEALEAYSLKQNALYRDLAIVESAMLMLKAGDVQSAHEKLKAIDAESSLYKVARLLMHYGAK